MRTLDEVIESMELTSDVNRHYREENADVLHYLKELQGQRSGWISVKDRLPETEGSYLAFCRYRDGGTRQTIKLWKGGVFTSETKQVTHWMPLPADPEEREK